MRNARRVTVAEIPTVEQPSKPDERQIVEVSVSYNEGGMNMFSYKQEQRGYYLSASPIVIGDRGNGVTMHSFRLMSGTKTFIEAATRFNAKRLAKVAASASEHPKYNEIIAYVCEKNSLHIFKSHEYDADGVCENCADGSAVDCWPEEVPA